LKAKLEVTVGEGRYLKFLYRRQHEESRRVGTSALAEAFGVKPATVTEMLQKLSRKGLLGYTHYRGVSLTEKGVYEAQRLLRKHRILEVLFVRLLGYSPEEACEEATELDHHVSERLANAICHACDHPGVCPCNKPISKDIECCRVK